MSPKAKTNALTTKVLRKLNMAFSPGTRPKCRVNVFLYYAFLKQNSQVNKNAAGDQMVPAARANLLFLRPPGGADEVHEAPIFRLLGLVPVDAPLRVDILDEFLGVLDTVEILIRGVEVVQMRGGE